MRIANRDRLWLLGGLVVALLLVFLAWQFMIKGQHDQTDSVRESVAAADQQVTVTTNRLNALKADSVNLDKYKAALTADQAALPATAGLARLRASAPSIGKRHRVRHKLAVDRAADGDRVHDDRQYAGLFGHDQRCRYWVACQ